MSDRSKTKNMLGEADVLQKKIINNFKRKKIENY